MSGETHSIPKAIFEKLSESHADRLMCLQSNIGSEDTCQIRPLFLYHARRTSGIAFFYALKGSIEAAFRLAGVDEASIPLMRRVETDDLSPEFLGNRFVLIGSHFRFGLHEKFSENFLLTTIVRDPYKRLGSTYMSGCFHNRIKPKLPEFEDYITNPENQNGIIRQLCGLDPADEVKAKHLDAAVDNLSCNFHSFITTRHTNDLISYYLSSFGLPNIVMNRPNRTLADYKIDTAPYRDFIIKRNELDFKLFEFVADNPRLPRHEVNTDRISPATFIGYEEVELANRGMIGMCIPTNKFIDTISKQPGIMDDLKRFWELFPAR